MGALAATYCLETLGTQEHNYSAEDFVYRFREHFEDHGALETIISTD
jgi:hypothetical protein